MGPAGRKIETGWRALAQSGKLGQIVLISFGVWLHAADELMVSTVTPVMIAEIGGAPFIAWLIALYEIGSIMAGAIAALVVIRAGLRNAMTGAALVYMTGCLVSATAPDMAFMLAGRLVQGCGGGAMIAISFVAVHRLIGADMTARAYALVSLVWGVSAFTGPMIGALFSDFGWWRGAFYLFAAQALAFSAIAFLNLGESSGEPDASQAGQMKGILIRMGVLAAGVLSIAAAGVTPSALQAALLLGFGSALLAGFVMLDASRWESRLLPARPFDPSLPQGAVLILVLFVSAATTGLITYGPVLMTQLHGFDAVTVGFILMLESIGWTLVAIATASLPRRLEPAAILGGFGAVALGIGLLAPAIAGGSPYFIGACAILQGGGFGAAWAFMIRRATVLAEKAERDRVASAIPTIQRLGYALGAALIGIIANASGFGDAASAETAEIVTGRIFFLSLAPCLVGIAAAWRFMQFREPA